MSELKMNKRTKKIAMRAFDETTGNTSIEGEKKSFAERFAELIIEECGEVLDPTQEGLISRAEAFDIIRKHFTT